MLLFPIMFSNPSLKVCNVSPGKPLIISEYVENPCDLNVSAKSENSSNFILARLMMSKVFLSSDWTDNVIPVNNPDFCNSLAIGMIFSEEFL